MPGPHFPSLFAFGPEPVKGPSSQRQCPNFDAVSIGNKKVAATCLVWLGTEEVGLWPSSEWLAQNGSSTASSLDMDSDHLSDSSASLPRTLDQKNSSCKFLHLPFLSSFSSQHPCSRAASALEARHWCPHVYICFLVSTTPEHGWQTKHFLRESVRAKRS